MIVEKMSIKAIIMPNFFVRIVLQIVFEMVDQTCILTKIINENSWSISKVVLWTCEKRGRYNSTFSDRCLVFNV